VTPVAVKRPWPAWLSVVLLGLSALALRLIYVWQVGGAAVIHPDELDPGLYFEWAQRIAAGDWIGNAPFVQSPLYAYLLGMLMKVLGTSIPRLLAVQALVGTGTVLLTYWLGRRLFGHRHGMVAGTALALYGPFLFYEGQIMKTFLSPFFTVLLALMLDVARERSIQAARAGRMFLLAGLVYGLLTLDRDNFILLAPALALLALVLGGGLGRAGARAAGLFTLGTVLMVAPVTARNWAVAHEFVLLTTGGGEVFYIGNNPDANGLYVPPAFVTPDPKSEHTDFINRASETTGRKLTPMQSSWFWFREGMAFIKDAPLDWLRLLWLKMVHFWNFYELPDNLDYEILQVFSPLLRWLNCNFAGTPLARLLPPAGVPVAVVPTGAGWLMVRLHLLSTFGALAPLGLAGIILTRRRWRRLLPLYVLLFGYMGTVLLFFNFSRFRVPVVPLLALFAAATLAWLWRGCAAAWDCLRALAVRSGDLTVRARALVPRGDNAVVLAALALLVLTVNAVRPRGVVVAIEQDLNRGNALYGEDRIDEALRSYFCGLVLLGEGPADARGDLLLRQCGGSEATRDAIRAELDVESVKKGPQFKGIHIGIHHGIGIALLQQADDRMERGERQQALSQIDDAIAQFMEVQKLAPAFLLSIRKLGSAYVLKGDTATALEWLRKGVDLWPEDIQARFDLAELLFRTGDHKGAMRQIDAAWHYAGGLDRTRQARMYFYRGKIFLEGLGDPGKALYDFEKALALDPLIPQEAEARQRIVTLRANGVLPIEDRPGPPAAKEAPPVPAPTP
jgi:tetratricopeptide (TPR) repeat protein